jgi:hypothetical protein
VLVTAVQARVPDPAFRICKVWLPGFAPFAGREKFMPPGTLSKKGLLVAETVSVIGITIAGAYPVLWPEITTSPV